MVTNKEKHKNMFLCISTLNNISNLIPILEFALEEDFIYVLKKDSDSYFKNFFEVLKNDFSYKNVFVENIELIDQFLKEKDVEFIYFIVNGGTKIDVIKVYNVLLEVFKDKKFCLLYNSIKPVKIDKILVGSKNSKHKEIPISLKKEENKKNKKKFNIQHLVKLKNFEIFLDDKSYNYQETIDNFNETLSFITWEIFFEKFRNKKELAINTVATVAKEQNKLISSLNFETFFDKRKNLYSFKKIQKFFENSLKKDIEKNKDLFKNFYNLFHNLFLEMTTKFFNSDSNQNKEKNQINGFKFEDYVYSRFMLWYNNNYNNNKDIFNIIQSIEKNVKIKENQTVFLELDIAILLKNGILLYIECKSVERVPIKELTARLEKLHQATSPYSEMILCFPFDIENGNQNEILNFNNYRLELEKNSIKILPFTKTKENIEFKINEKKYTVFSFENQLYDIFSKYVKK